MILEEGKVIAEHYKLLKQLGHGSFGNVWLAHNILADVDVAIKFYGALDQNGLEDFRNEFKIAYKLRHPNLLNINHFDVYESCPYLVMPYCANGSVASHIGQMEEPEIWKFIHDVASGLAFLHGLQPAIIHQDIKPDNILITSEGRYVITDFGISRSFRTRLSKASNLPFSSGTIAYMGPERFSSKPVVVLASDIWAFGATLYEIATGDILWEGMGGCVQLNGASLPDMDDKYSPELCKLIMSCLAAETWNRPTAADIYEYAVKILQDRHPSTNNIKPTRPLPPNAKPVAEVKPEPERKAVSQSVSTSVSTPVSTPTPVTVYPQRPSPKPSVTPTPTPKSDWKRWAGIAAAVIGALLLITGIYNYISSINEEQAFISCQTKQDYEQFVKDHPHSSYTEKALKHIAEMSTPSSAEPSSAPTVTASQPSAGTTSPQPASRTVRVVEQPQTRTVVKTEPHNAATSQPTSQQPQPTSNNSGVTQDDLDYFKCITAADFHNYLVKYPKGKHRQAATNALTSLNNQSGANTVTTGTRINDGAQSRTVTDEMPTSPPHRTAPPMRQNVGRSTSTNVNIGVSFGSRGDRRPPRR